VDITAERKISAGNRTPIYGPRVSSSHLLVCSPDLCPFLSSVPYLSGEADSLILKSEATISSEAVVLRVLQVLAVFLSTFRQNL
jgi:hypothetical protein